MTFLYILSKALFAAVVALGFGLVSNPPRRAIYAILLTGFIGYFSRACMMEYLNVHIFLACLICAFIMGSCGLIFGRLTRTPSTVIYIPALLPMNPLFSLIIMYFSFFFNICPKPCLGMCLGMLRFVKLVI